MEIKAIIGTSNLILLFILQVSPIPGMIDGCRKGDIKSMTIGYFLAGITQNCFWFGYGLCLHDFFVYFPNVPGTILFTIFLNMLIYVKKKYNYFLLNVFIVFELIIIVSFFPEKVCVTSATILSFIWQTTNLETIRLALRYHSQEYINPLLSFISFLAFLTSCIYSIMIRAFIMFLPNSYGLLINIINLYLYLWAGGFFDKDNSLVNYLSKILKIENIQDDVNSNKVDFNVVDKEQFLNNI